MREYRPDEGDEDSIDWPGHFRLALVVSMVAGGAALVLAPVIGSTALIVSVIVGGTCASWFQLERNDPTDPTGPTGPPAQSSSPPDTLV